MSGAFAMGLYVLKSAMTFGRWRREAGQYWKANRVRKMGSYITSGLADARWPYQSAKQELYVRKPLFFKVTTFVLSIHWSEHEPDRKIAIRGSRCNKRDDGA
jgi:hypothetical protein